MICNIFYYDHRTFLQTRMTKKLYNEYKQKLQRSIVNGFLMLLSRNYIVLICKNHLDFALKA